MHQRLNIYFNEINMDSTKLYKEYNKRVQEYMGNVISCLEQDYGKIPESWRVSLDLIADNYSLYLEAKDNIKKNGIMCKDTHGRPYKNQCVMIMNGAQNQLKDLLKSFALTPMSKSKMKHFESNEINEEEYLEELCS